MSKLTCTALILLVSYITVGNSSPVSRMTVRSITLPNELEDAGRSGQAICPFIVINQVRQNLLPGGLSLNFTEIICSGQCDDCTRTGRSCQQLHTNLSATVHNPETGLPQLIQVEDVRSSCVCAREDEGDPAVNYVS